MFLGKNTIFFTVSLKPVLFMLLMTRGHPSFALGYASSADIPAPIAVQ